MKNQFGQYLCLFVQGTKFCFQLSLYSMSMAWGGLLIWNLLGVHLQTMMLLS